MSPRDTARRLAEEGAQRALFSAAALSADWLDAARSALDAAIESGKPFTSESLIAEAGLPIASDPRAIGGLILAARKARLIEPTGRIVRAKRTARHGGLVREWRRNDP